MSKIAKDKSIERIQENLGKLVDTAQSCIGSDPCYGICELLRKKDRRNWTEEDIKLWNTCGQCQNY